MTTAARLTGPASHFRPKDPRPVTLNLTTEARNVLDGICERQQASRGDVFEFLLRHYGHLVDFSEDG